MADSCITKENIYFCISIDNNLTGICFSCKIIKSAIIPLPNFLT